MSWLVVSSWLLAYFKANNAITLKLLDSSILLLIILIMFSLICFVMLFLLSEKRLVENAAVLHFVHQSGGPYHLDGDASVFQLIFKCGEIFCDVLHVIPFISIYLFVSFLSFIDNLGMPMQRIVWQWRWQSLHKVVWEVLQVGYMNQMNSCPICSVTPK